MHPRVVWAAVYVGTGWGDEEVVGSKEIGNGSGGFGGLL